MDQPPAPAQIELALRAFGILHRKAPLRLGLGIDQIGQRLGLDQIDLAVEKGAAREFAGFGMPDAVEAGDRLQHLGHDGAPAMDMEFGDILAGKAVGPGKEDDQATVEHGSVRRPELAQKSQRGP